MTLEEIKKKLFKYADNPSFEMVFNYLFRIDLVFLLIEIVCLEFYW